ncbi:MAG TPA: hypothetical protein VFJ64_01130, partial [Solirubrobacterales bacterium]|nr:hypothetical protein [Solirubrobacterales bacterium]
GLRGVDVESHHAFRLGHVGTSHDWGVGRGAIPRPSPRTVMRGVPTYLPLESVSTPYGLGLLGQRALVNPA